MNLRRNQGTGSVAGSMVTSSQAHAATVPVPFRWARQEGTA